MPNASYYGDDQALSAEISQLTTGQAQGVSLLGSGSPMSIQNFYAAQDIPITTAGIGGGGGGSAPAIAVPPPAVMGAAAAIPGVATALGISLPEGVLAALGLVGAVYGGYQALGGGEGGGILGNNLLGGDVSTIPGTDIVLQGPGLPEPYPRQIVKEWVANGSQFYLLTDGRIAVYSRSKRRWKAYRPPKLAVIGKNLPSHKMITRLRRNLKKHQDDAVTILKMTAPNKLEHHHKLPKRYR